MNDEDNILYERMLRSFTNITPSGDQIERIEELRAYAKTMMFQIISASSNSRERSLALTHLETSLMYAVKAVLMSA